jgi:transposase-like protein
MSTEKISCPICRHYGNNAHERDKVSFRCGRCGSTWPRHDTQATIAELQQSIQDQLNTIKAFTAGLGCETSTEAVRKLSGIEQQIREAEREACAKVCEQAPKYVGSRNEIVETTASECAKAIRMRSNVNQG